MCLDRVLPKKQADEIIQQARKRGYIKVYKVCIYKSTGWMWGKTWRKGLRKAFGLYNKDAGWYAFLTEEAAKEYSKNHSWYIKVCYAKPAWIKRLGRYFHCGKAGIFTHLAFPDWNKGTMTVAEFKQMCKDYKNNR